MNAAQIEAPPTSTEKEDVQKPFVTSRKYIKWLDAEGNGTAQEPTSTIILVVPTESFFVDVRIYKAALQRHGSSGQTTVELAPEDLEWANAGQSSSTDLPGDSIWDVRRSFTHWVDSRFGLDATISPDVGHFRDAGDGTGESIEVGEMVNPATGVLQRYEERWTAIEIEKIVNTSGRKEDRWVALRTSDQSTETRGLVILLGQYMEGILHRHGKVYVERWEYKANGGDTEQGKVDAVYSGYMPVARLGEAGVLPDPKLVWDKKGSFDYKGVQWELFYKSS